MSFSTIEAEFLFDNILIMCNCWVGSERISLYYIRIRRSYR